MITVLQNQPIPPRRNCFDWKDVRVAIDALKKMQPFNDATQVGDCLVFKKYPIRLIQHINNNALPIEIIFREVKSGKWYVWRKA